MPSALLILVLALPIAVYGNAAGWSPIFVFILAALTLVPLAGLISIATDFLARQLGSTIGGLLNATFGNAAELIIGIIALAHGLNDVVRASISGSVIGNSLLVLGTAMLAGGWRHREQRFDAGEAGRYASLLALAAVGLMIPTVAALLGGSLRGAGDIPSASQDHALSIVVAIALLIGYVGYIAHSIFGVRAKSVPGAGENVAPPTEKRRDAPEPEAPFLPDWAPAWLQPAHSPLSGMLWLGAATVLTAVASEILVGAIEPVAQQIGLSTFFIGLIVLPIVGNAGEHFSAITMAVEDKMDATMAITAGSAIQVALLLAPVLVLVSNIFDRPLDFIFIPLELAIFALVALIYPIVSLDGQSTWLEGLLLLLFYIVVAASAFVIPH